VIRSSHGCFAWAAMRLSIPPLVPGRRSDGADPDSAVVRRAAEGDPRAWKTLVDRHMGRIHAVSLRLLGDATEAEDVTQETFLRAWRTIGDWQPGAARYGTWLHRVALNLCRDRLRRRRPVSLDDLPDMADGAPSPDAGLQRQAVTARVRAALDGLPERQREVLVLSYYENMSNIEAAAILEVSVEAVESLLSRARRRLRADLAAVAPDLMGDITP